MSSGVTVHADVSAAVEEMKKRNCSIIIFKLNDELSEIIVDEKCGKDMCSGEERLETLKQKLPKDEPRYALLEFLYSNEEGHARDTVVFVSWSPDTAKTKLKMCYAASKVYIVKASSASKVVQATDLSELDHKEVRSKCLKA